MKVKHPDVVFWVMATAVVLLYAAAVIRGMP